MRKVSLLFPSQDEKFDPDKGPSVKQLVIQESVDKLDYMGWQVDQGADPEKVDQYWEFNTFSLACYKIDTYNLIYRPIDFLFMLHVYKQ